jgi:hypothetical protein
MIRGFVTGVSLAILGLCVAPALAQRVDLREARRTVLDHSTHQLSTLESVVTRVPPHAQGRITEAIKANETSRNDALAALETARKGHISNEEGMSRAYYAVEQGTRKHTEVLTGLLDTVPEEAKPAIERALVVSQTGRNTALGNLNSIQQGQKPSGVFTGAGPGTSIGRPGAIGKPEDSGIVTGSGRKPEPPSGGGPSGIGKPSIPGKVGGPIGGGGGIFGGGGIGSGRPGR